MLAKKVRGAAKVIVIDSLQYRLDHVSKHVPGVETINRKEHKVGTFLSLLVDYQDSAIPCGIGVSFSKEAQSKHLSLNVCVSAKAAQPLSRLDGATINLVSRVYPRHSSQPLIIYAQRGGRINAKSSLHELQRLFLQSVYDQLRKIWPRGPDVGIEAVGNHYHEGSLLQKVEQAVSGETDPSEMLDEIIYCTRKVSVGAWFQ
jgi:threonine dehydrogenase-like Zn-dependent dehydrogenase